VFCWYQGEEVRDVLNVVRCTRQSPPQQGIISSTCPQCWSRSPPVSKLFISYHPDEKIEVNGEEATCSQLVRGRIGV
jgi:hypothetical protein